MEPHGGVYYNSTENLHMPCLSGTSTALLTCAAPRPRSLISITHRRDAQQASAGVIWAVLASALDTAVRQAREVGGPDEVLGVLWHDDKSMDEQLRYLHDATYPSMLNARKQVVEGVKALEGNLQILPAGRGEWDQRARHLAALRDNCVLMPFTHPRVYKGEFSAEPFMHLLAALRQRYMASILDTLLKYINSFVVTSAQLASSNVLVEKNKHKRTFDNARKNAKKMLDKRLEEEKRVLRTELGEILGQDLLVRAGRKQHAHASMDVDSKDENSNGEDLDIDANNGNSSSRSGSGSESSSHDGISDDEADENEDVLVEKGVPHVHAHSSGASENSADSSTKRFSEWTIDESEWRPFRINLQRCLRSYLTRMKEICYDLALKVSYDYYANSFNKNKKSNKDESKDESDNESVGDNEQAVTTSAQSERAEQPRAPVADATTTHRNGSSEEVNAPRATATAVADHPTLALQRTPSRDSQGETEQQPAAAAVGELLTSWAELHKINSVVLELRASEDKALFEDVKPLTQLCRQAITHALAAASHKAQQKRKRLTAHDVQRAVLDRLFEQFEETYFSKWEQQFEGEYVKMLENTKKELYEILSADSDNKDKVISEATTAKQLAHHLKAEVWAELKKHPSGPELNQSKRLAQDPAPSSTTPLYSRVFDNSIELMEEFSKKPGTTSLDEGMRREVVLARPSGVNGTSAANSAYLPSHIRSLYAADNVLQLHMTEAVRQQLTQYSAVVNQRSFDLGPAQDDYIFPIVTAVFLPDDGDSDSECKRVEELLTKETFDGVHHLHLLLVLPRQVQRLETMFVNAGQRAQAEGEGRLSSFHAIRSSKLLCILPHDRVKPSSSLDVGKHVVAEFGFVFSWRLSQVVDSHFEVGMLRNTECSRARLLLHMQRLVVLYFLYILEQIRKAVETLGPTPDMLVNEWGKLMESGEIKFAQWRTGSSAMMLVAKKDSVITETEFDRLHDVVEHLMPDGIARTDLPAELLPVLSSVRTALRQWQCVTMYAVYNQRNVRWRFYPIYPDFHRLVRRSYEIHSLVLDHATSQRHAWYSRERRQEQHIQLADPYPDLNTFYNAIRDAERRFMRVFHNSKEVTMMMFLGAFALKLAPFHELEPIRRTRKSKLAAAGGTITSPNAQMSKRTSAGTANKRTKKESKAKELVTALSRSSAAGGRKRPSGSEAAEGKKSKRKK